MEKPEILHHDLSLHNVTDKWCVIGDFNEILSQEDKREGPLRSFSHCSHFDSCIKNCNLIDSSFKGSKYTWSNHRVKRKDLLLE